MVSEGAVLSETTRVIKSMTAVLSETTRVIKSMTAVVSETGSDLLESTAAEASVNGFFAHRSPEERQTQFPSDTAG